MTLQQIRELQPQKSIKYYKNWNRKHLCNFYTSIRLHSDYWKAADYYQVIVNGSYDHKAQLQSKKTFLLHELPEISAYLDTGMNLQDTKALFMKMYPGKDWYTQKLDILLFRNLEVCN